MSADEKEVMGELINLEDWKIQKELEEIQELRAQIREIQDEEGLPEQSPYYPKHYFEPEEVDVYERITYDEPSFQTSRSSDPTTRPKIIALPSPYCRL